MKKKEESKELDQLVSDMKYLISLPEWKALVEHINQNIIPAHKEACVNNSFIRNTKEAENQAVLIEGIIEAIEEPQNLIDTHDSNPIKKLCHACGRMFK